MKNKLLAVSIILFSLTLTSCGNKKTEESKQSTVASSERVKTEESTTFSENQGDVARFKGKISEVPVLDEQTVQITFDQVEALEDPDELVDSFNASGVVLLVDLESLDGFKTDDLNVGDEIEFTIGIPAAMTFSIPPQISGSSIKMIKPID